MPVGRSVGVCGVALEPAYRPKQTAARLSGARPVLLDHLVPELAAPQLADNNADRKMGRSHIILSAMQVRSAEFPPEKPPALS